MMADYTPFFVLVYFLFLFYICEWQIDHETDILVKHDRRERRFLDGRMGG